MATWASLTSSRRSIKFRDSQAAEIPSRPDASKQDVALSTRPQVVDSDAAVYGENREPLTIPPTHTLIIV